MAETVERKPFKSIHIDTEKGIYLLNGEEVPMVSRIDLEFNNGKWSLLITRDRKYSRESVYSYEEHVKLAEELDKNGKLPASFMVVAPGSWNQMEVWDDINRMRTLNTTQSRRRLQMHVCPLQLDIVERIIDRFSNPGETVLDPFGGLMTVPMTAVKMNRKGYGIELSPDYFRDGVGYLQEAENERETPTLFDFIEGGEYGSNS